jgi:hypothetical protein
MAEPTNLLAFPALSKQLGIPPRTLRRLQAAGVIEPAVPGKGRTAALYEPMATARAIIAERTGGSARDRRDDAQARLLELKISRESRDLLDRATIDRAASTIIHTARGRLLRLPAELVRAGLVPASGEALITQAIHETLRELARLASVAELVG